MMSTNSCSSGIPAATRTHSLGACRRRGRLIPVKPQHPNSNADQSGPCLLCEHPSRRRPRWRLFSSHNLRWREGSSEQRVCHPFPSIRPPRGPYLYRSPLLLRRPSIRSLRHKLNVAHLGIDRKPWRELLGRRRRRRGSEVSKRCCNRLCIHSCNVILKQCRNAFAARPSGIRRCHRGMPPSVPI